MHQPGNSPDHPSDPAATPSVAFSAPFLPPVTPQSDLKSLLVQAQHDMLTLQDAGIMVVEVSMTTTRINIYIQDPTADQVTFLNGRYGQLANVLHDEDRPRTSGEGEGFIRRPGQQNWEPLTPDNRP